MSELTVSQKLASKVFRDHGDYRRAYGTNEIMGARVPVIRRGVSRLGGAVFSVVLSTVAALDAVYMEKLDNPREALALGALSAFMIGAASLLGIDHLTAINKTLPNSIEPHDRPDTDITDADLSALFLSELPPIRVEHAIELILTDAEK